MDTLVPSAEKTTLIKVFNANNESSIEASSSWDDLDLCCPKYNDAKVKKVLKTVNDSVERIRKVARLTSSNSTLSSRTTEWLVVATTVTPPL